MSTTAPKRIDLSEWSLKGEGLFGSVYESDRYPGVILKLNKKTDREGPWEEYDKSRRIIALGVKTPRVYDFVTDGKHFGYTAPPHATHSRGRDGSFCVKGLSQKCLY